MEGLQRSAISFRRQGSSGLVWDDKLISGELIRDISSDGGDESHKIDNHDDHKAELRRSKSDGGGKRVYRTVKVEHTEDPPSPRVSGCGFGFCSVFGVAKFDDKKKSGKIKHIK